jgi:hypothetical protein
MSKSGKEQKFQEILRTFNQADIVFIKSVFDEHGILYYINNEHVDMVGMLSFAEPMRVMVAEKDFEDARDILKEFKGHFTKLTDLED